MLLEPTLRVRELAIYRGRGYAYRATFHRGVNIISGENSSGKSTILSLLVYGLGADIASWSEHALLCDRVSVEVSLNQNVVTLSRLISQQLGQPMEIFPGDLATAEKAPASEWLRYPYRTTSSKGSFSQAVFHLLNVPELETEASGKLTLHQVFRVLYSDQLSAVEKIFRTDNFDSPALREAVGRLLFGAYESDIYANQLKIRELEKELAAINAALKSIYALLAGVNHSLTLDWVEAERQTIMNQLRALDAEIARADEQLYADEDEAGLSLEPQANAFAKTQRVQKELAKLQDNEQALELEIADSDLFIMTLDRKIEALQDSSVVAEAVSEIHYSSCPSCFADIGAHSNAATCRLCKEPFDEDRMRRRIVAQLNDMLIQSRQSRAIQKERRLELDGLVRTRAELEERWIAARNNLAQVRRAPTSVARDAIRKLNERYGYLQRELEAIGEKAELIGRLDAMSRDKVTISAAITELTDTNSRLKISESGRLEKAYTAVADETKFFLHRDLPRQDSFQNAESVGFSFAKDSISVDGQSYFSASSTVYLKNSFLSAFLFSAAVHSQFRHFRVLILDTIEDKGMEPERSQNFQQLLVDRSSAIEADHQVIFATAMINPALDTDAYVVGRRSTHEARTLLVNAEVSSESSQPQ